MKKIDNYTIWKDRNDVCLSSSVNLGESGFVFLKLGELTGVSRTSSGVYLRPALKASEQAEAPWL